MARLVPQRYTARMLTPLLLRHGPLLRAMSDRDQLDDRLENLPGT